MTGVILCGGQSTRMGTDKGMLQRDTTTWAQLAFNKLAALSIPVVLSVNQQQQNSYRNIFDQSLLIEDDSKLDIGGPLRGILSVHNKFPSVDLFVLACDMLAMDALVIDVLYENTLTNNNNEALVFKNEQKVEPLCGVYLSKGLKHIYALYQQQQLKKHSMMYVLKSLNTKYLSLPDTWEKYFNNYNSPEDFV
jgi:molybdopterin-guanine dinucleotide biosynthesis protein A